AIASCTAPGPADPAGDPTRGHHAPRRPVTYRSPRPSQHRRQASHQTPSAPRENLAHGFAPGPSRWASVTEPARMDRLQFVHAMISAYEILEKSRAAGQRLPYNEAAVLFAGAVRLAAAHDSTLGGRLVRIDDAVGLAREAFDEQAPAAEPAYLAPELLSADAPDKNDPKVQVYAAGVLGYELLTGRLAPPPGHA